MPDLFYFNRHFHSMQAGIPVGTLAIGKAGAINAALLAVAVLALNDSILSQKLDNWRQQQTDSVSEFPESIFL